MAGIYIHIPFCKTRCIYCDFFTQTDDSQKSIYVESACKELALRKAYLGGEPISTIFFGGGTPSQLGEKDFKLFFDAIYNNYEVSPDAEITIETNPDDLTESYVAMLSILPFNRISIGTQSFDDKELKFLNRRHSAAKAIESVERCQRAGFNNISIDLMYGLPNQTMETWRSSVQKAIALNIQHISAYHLIYEKETHLFNLLEAGEIKEVDESLSIEMYRYLHTQLQEAGFTHYEISNFAKDGYISKHNSSYWKGVKYLGIGPSAHSFDGHSRQWNIHSISEYIDKINKGELAGEIEKSSKDSQYNDYILTRMRTMWGASLSEIEQLFGVERLKYCVKNATKHIQTGTLKMTDDRLIISEEGMLVSDGIMSDLMYIE